VKFAVKLNKFIILVIFGFYKYTTIRRIYGYANFFIHKNKNYELVYADKLNSIYLKNKDANKDLISKYGVKKIGKNVFHQMKEIKPNNNATIISTIFNPFYSTTKNKSNNDFLRERQLYFQYMNLKFQ